MPEIENHEAQLQNFIMEIKKVKECFPSLFAVENVNDLQLEESNVWQEFKILFRQMEEELSKAEMPAKEALSELKTRVEDLAKVIRKNITGIKNENRLEFLAWMNNRLNGLIGDVDYLQTEGEEDGVLQEVKDSMSKQKKNLLF